MNSIRPTNFYSDNQIHIWYKMDRSFLIPKSSIYINFFSPYMRTNTKDLFCVEIFYNYIRYIIDFTFSDAKDAGNEINIINNENGITIMLNCYSDVVDRIIYRIFDLLYGDLIDESTFNQMKLMSNDVLESSRHAQPFEKIFLLFSKIIKENIFIYSDMQQVYTS